MTRTWSSFRQQEFELQTGVPCLFLIVNSADALCEKRCSELHWQVMFVGSVPARCASWKNILSGLTEYRGFTLSSVICVATSMSRVRVISIADAKSYKFQVNHVLTAPPPSPCSDMSLHARSIVSSFQSLTTDTHEWHTRDTWHAAYHTSRKTRVVGVLQNRAS